MQTSIETVKNDAVFGEYGRLLFPVDNGYMSGNTLGELQFTWYSYMDSDKTVEIVNTLWHRASAGETIFYDIYTEEEKAADPAKKDTGLFFFRGGFGEKFAVCSAGGGFAYVGAMHDSFPHALELSKQGYNAFALIYRPGAQTACEDLARAISFIFENAEELKVNTDCYSLWGWFRGGADGGLAWLLLVRRPLAGTILPQSRRSDYAVYRPQRLYSKMIRPPIACVGERDGIADWRTMQRRLDAMSALGIPTEFHHYPGIAARLWLGNRNGGRRDGWTRRSLFGRRRRMHN